MSMQKQEVIRLYADRQWGADTVKRVSDIVRTAQTCGRTITASTNGNIIALSVTAPVPRQNQSRREAMKARKA